MPPMAAPTSQPTKLSTPSSIIIPTHTTTSPSANPSTFPLSALSSTPSVVAIVSESTSLPTVLHELPINDLCVNAIGPLPSDFSSNFGTIENAGLDNVDRCGDIVDIGPGVWYYIIGSGGEMMVVSSECCRLTCHYTSHKCSPNTYITFWTP